MRRPPAIGATLHFEMENIKAVLLSRIRPGQKASEPTDEKSISNGRGPLVAEPRESRRRTVSVERIRRFSVHQSVGTEVQHGQHKLDAGRCRRSVRIPFLVRRLVAELV